MTVTARATHYPPGEIPQLCNPGDIGLSRGSEDYLTRLIQGGEVARGYEGHWDHSWLIVDVNGDIVEANRQGMQRKPIEEYRHHDFMVISPTNVPAYSRELACEFMLAHVGDKYGILNFVGLAIQALFGFNISVHMDDQFICSGAVSRATEKYIATYPRSPESMMPEDIEYFWGVRSCEPPIKPTWFTRFWVRLRTIIGALFRHGRSTDPATP